MMATELIAVATITLFSGHADRSMHALAWGVGFVGVLASPIAVLAGSIAALIASGKYRKQLATEVSH
jgi:uncharacterized membrane protein YdjX (TVP38/TMEM64 family)